MAPLIDRQGFISRLLLAGFKEKQYSKAAWPVPRYYRRDSIGQVACVVPFVGQGGWRAEITAWVFENIFAIEEPMPSLFIPCNTYEQATEALVEALDMLARYEAKTNPTNSYPLNSRAERCAHSLEQNNDDRHDTTDHG